MLDCQGVHSLFLPISLGLGGKEGQRDGKSLLARFPQKGSLAICQRHCHKGGREGAVHDERGFVDGGFMNSRERQGYL